MYLTAENFEATLTSSMQKPLFCLFYKEVPECQAAKNALCAMISDGNEFVIPVLCDLNEQCNQLLAAQIGLMNMPTLVVVDRGQPADILEGTEQITSGLQDTLNRFMPDANELLMREALEAESSGDLNKACSKAAQAYAGNTENRVFKYIYARILIALKNTVKAHELLDNPGREEAADPDYQQLISALSLAEQAQNSPELIELKEKFESEPSDENAVALSVALAAAGKKEEALQILFKRLKESLDKEDVKKTFLDILATMDGDKLQGQYRRKLYTLMY